MAGPYLSTVDSSSRARAGKARLLVRAHSRPAGRRSLRSQASRLGFRQGHRRRPGAGGRVTLHRSAVDLQRLSGIPHGSIVGQTSVGPPAVPREPLDAAGYTADRRSPRHGPARPSVNARAVTPVVPRSGRVVQEGPQAGYEADLPAQEATSREGAWVPGTDALEGRPPGAGRPEGEGAPAAHSLSRDEVRSPSIIVLRGRTTFVAIQDRGSGRSARLLSLRYLANGRPDNRFGLSTGRRIGGAVVRNRVRRRLRQLIRALGPRLSRGWDILVVARPESAEATYQELSEALEGLVRRAGIMERTESRGPTTTIRPPGRSPAVDSTAERNT